MLIRDITVGDYPEILKMNEASEHYLSPLNYQRLEVLHQQSKYHKVIELEGTLAAFVLAFDRDADYDSPNYFMRHFFISTASLCVKNSATRIGRCAISPRTNLCLAESVCVSDVRN